MTSEVYVWTYLPGDVDPTVCGRFEYEITAAGAVGSFVYGTSYLKDPDAVSLDPIALPLREQEFRTTLSKGVFGALLDAIPDDWGRYVIDKWKGKQTFPIGYMLHTSDDSVGNLAFSDSSKTPPERTRAVGVESIALARDIVLELGAHEDVPPELVAKVRANTAMGGARPKLTVEKDGKLWLAKFPLPKDDTIVPVAKLEAAMLDLARRCFIDAARGHVVLDDVLLVERFDRGPIDSAGKGRREAFLSGRTLFEWSGFRADFGGSYVRLASELTRYSSQGSADRAELFRRMVFNAQISNTDDHERNHGLVADDIPGEFRLSPAYDMVPRVHGTSLRHQAMIVGGAESLATKENLLSDCEAFGLDRSEAEAVFDEVSELVASHWRQCLRAQGVSEEGIGRVEGCFKGVPDAAPADRPRRPGR